MWNQIWRRKADLLYKYNSTKTFDSNAELYWDELEQIWFCKKVGKLGVEYLPFWKNFSILYHILENLNLVLAGNSNVVEITKESCNYSKNLPLQLILMLKYMGDRDTVWKLKNPQSRIFWWIHNNKTCNCRIVVNDFQFVRIKISDIYPKKAFRNWQNCQKLMAEIVFNFHTVWGLTITWGEWD